MNKLLNYTGLQHYHEKVQGQISQLRQEVDGVEGAVIDLSQETQRYGRIDGSSWVSRSSKGHYMLSVVAGEEYKMEAYDNADIHYAILAQWPTYNYGANNAPSDTPMFSSQTGFTSVNTVTAGSTLTFTVPSDGVGLYFQLSYTPENLQKVGEDGISQRLATVEGDVNVVKPLITEAPAYIDFSLYTKKKGNVYNNEDGWTNRSTYLHYVIPVQGGRSYVVTPPATGKYHFSFLKTSPTYVNDAPTTAPDYATGFTGAVAFLNGRSTTVVAPIDAGYIYLYVSNGASTPSVYYTGAIDYQLPSLIPSGQRTYIGEKITLNRYSFSMITHIEGLSNNQGGAIYDGKFFIYDGNGGFSVYDLETKSLLDTFTLPEHLSIYPHGNAVFFGNKYDAGDTYPILYVNGYHASLPKGEVYGYRITESGGEFSATFVHTIAIAFVNDSLWTDGAGDTRPYGNFVFDFERGLLYAYTILDTTNVTRFFAFDMPSASANAALQTTDIKFYFDCPRIIYPQDNCFAGGRIFIEAGYGTSANPSFVYVVDPVSRRFASIILLRELGYSFEPEYIDVYKNAIYMGKQTMYKCLF